MCVYKSKKNLNCKHVIIMQSEFLLASVWFFKQKILKLCLNLLHNESIFEFFALKIISMILKH
jgi:hypothetical protein